MAAGCGGGGVDFPIERKGQSVKQEPAVRRNDYCSKAGHKRVIGKKGSSLDKKGHTTPILRPASSPRARGPKLLALAEGSTRGSFIFLSRLSPHTHLRT